MITINVKNKEINASDIANWIVENERNAETIRFVLNNVEFEGDYHFYLFYRNAEDKGGAEALNKTESGNTYYLDWTPSADFSQVKGKMMIQIVGLSFAGTTGNYTVASRWSSFAYQITLPENIETGEIAPSVLPSVIEDAFADLASFVDGKLEDIDAYTLAKKGQLDTYTTSKEGELDAYALQKREELENLIPQTVHSVEAVTSQMSIKPFNTATLRLGEDNEYSVLELGMGVQLKFIVDGVETTEASIVTGLNVTMNT